MALARACCIAVVLALGCRSAEEPSAPEDRASDPSLQEELQVNAPSESAEAPATKPDELVPFVEVEEELVEVDDEPEEDLTKEDAPRDLAAELRTAVGTLSDCVRDFQAPTGRRTIQVTVSATVRPSGVIILPEAFGTGLSNDARMCIIRRVGAVTLLPLGGDVSQRVSTIIEIEALQTGVATPKPVMAEPQLRNVRGPLPPRPDIDPTGTPIQDRAGRPIQDPASVPIQDHPSRKVRGPKPRAIDGHEVDENAKDWR